VLKIWCLIFRTFLPLFSFIFFLSILIFFFNINFSFSCFFSVLFIFFNISIFSESSNGKLFSISNELEISEIEQRHHNQQFTCIVSQFDKEIEQKTISKTVNVQWMPKDTKIAADEIYQEKTAVSLACQSKLFFNS